MLKRTAFGMMLNLLLIGMIILAFDVHFVEALESGLVCYWKFDEGTGTTAVDSSGHNNNGSLISMDPETSWVDGIYGKALSFDGVNDHVEKPDASFAEKPETISLWFRANEINDEGLETYQKMTLIQYGDIFWGIQISSSTQKIQYHYYDGSPHDWYSASAINIGQWHHLAIVSNSSSSEMFLDGSSEGTSTSSLFNNTGGSNRDLIVGGKISGYPSGDSFNGTIDEVRMYNRTLSGEEIEALSSGLVGHWKFEEDVLSQSWDFDVDPAGWIPIDGNWTVHDGVYEVNSSDWGTSCGGESYWEDYTVETRAKPRFSVYAHDVSLAARATRDGDPTNYGFRIVPGYTSNNVVLEKYIDGVRTSLGELTESVSTDVWYNMTLRVSGNSITAWLNGTQKFSVTDDDISSGDIQIAAKGNAYFDYVRVNIEGIAEDSSGNDNHGVIHGAALVDEVYGEALGFDGLDDYVRIDPFDDQLIGGGTEVTMCAWINVKNLGSETEAGKIIASSGYAWILALDYQKLAMEVWTEGAPHIDSLFSIIPELNRWYFLCGVYEDGIMKLYVDGDLNATKTHAYGGPLKDVSEVEIGRLINFDGEHFNGTIDEVRIYNRALSEEEIRTLGYFPHDPILINGDEEFTSENGVVEGSGTADNPYIIARWEISGSGLHGIIINNTRAYFNLRDLSIHEVDTGIHLKNVSNGRVENNFLTNNVYGIEVLYSNEVDIKANIVGYNSHSGLCMGYSNHTRIMNNTIINNAWERPTACGIESFDFYFATISGNNISGHCKVAPQAAIRGVENSTIFRNNIFNNSNGVGYVDNCVIYENDIFNNTRGLSRVSNSTLYHNNIVNNTYQTSSILTGNSWNDGYPSGGNYWGDYSDIYPSVVDEYHGASQDVLGHDGIWDSAYEIDADNQDTYPLVEPWSPGKLEGDVNGDGVVDVFDLSILGQAYGCFHWMPCYNRTADLNLDGVVDAQDLAVVTWHYGETDP